MNIMQTYPVNLIGGTGKHYLLLNKNGRLSECTCCCPIDRTLYLHLEPRIDDANCVDIDQGPNTGGWPFSIYNPGFQNCDLRSTDINNEVLQPGEDNGVQCYQGDPSPAPVGGAADIIPFGLGVSLSCNPVNRWRIDICFQPQSHPDWPVDDDDFPGVCAEAYAGVPPLVDNTCKAEPGEFLLDFGDFQPLRGTEDDPIHGDYLIKPYVPSGGCLCNWHLYIDEFPDPSLAEQNNLYWYPFESRRGMWRASLPDMIAFHEEMPTIGTPLHVDRPPSTYVPREPDDFPEDLGKWLEEL